MTKMKIFRMRKKILLTFAFSTLSLSGAASLLACKNPSNTLSGNLLATSLSINAPEHLDVKLTLKMLEEVLLKTYDVSKTKFLQIANFLKNLNSENFLLSFLQVHQMVGNADAVQALALLSTNTTFKPLSLTSTNISSSISFLSFLEMGTKYLNQISLEFVLEYKIREIPLKAHYAISIKTISSGKPLGQQNGN